MEAGDPAKAPAGRNRVRARLRSISRFVPSRDAEAAPQRESGDGPPVASSLEDSPAPARRLPLESPFVVALAAAAIAIVLLGGLTYFAARSFTSEAADSRASEEAVSFAEHSSTLATGDAFAGYLQILRYADDNVVRAKATSREQREAALQQQIYLNTNKMQVLAVANADGLVIASAGGELETLKNSEAFLRAVSSVGPANSDILIPDDAPAYIEYATPLKDPVDGAAWGVLYARAAPDMLWHSTIAASIDGSRNVIINQKGQFAAGVPMALVGEPWGGALLENGGVRADIAGIDSICGLGGIARNTQIDRGWAVASCLPASLIQVEAGDAMGQLGLVVVAGCVLAIAIVAVILRLVLPDRPTPAHTETPSGSVGTAEQVAGSDVADGVETPEAEASEPAPLEPQEVPEPEPSTPVPPTIVIVPDVSALTLIDAYEERSARMADRIRERLSAPLMIAASQAEAAFAQAADAADAASADTADDADEAAPQRLSSPSLDAARRLHATAILEIEGLRERELRSIGDELYPAPVRLGLPAALRQLGRRYPTLNTVIDAAADSDSPGGSDDRPVVEDARRLVVYRTAREALNAAALAGADGATVTLGRDGGDLLLDCSQGKGAFDAAQFDACSIAAEVYGGALSIDEHRLSLRLPAPDSGERPTAVAFDVDDDEQGSGEDGPVTATPARVIAFPAPVEAEAGAFRRALDEAVAAVDGIDVTLDVSDTLEDEPLDPELAGALLTVAGRTLQTGATRAQIVVQRVRDGIMASVTLAGADADSLSSPAFDAARSLIESRGGTVTAIDTDGGCLVSVDALATLPVSIDEPTVVRLEPRVDDPAA